jgi:hypothetical protein
VEEEEEEVVVLLLGVGVGALGALLLSEKGTVDGGSTVLARMVEPPSFVLGRAPPIKYALALSMSGLIATPRELGEKADAAVPAAARSVKVSDTLIM